MRLRELELDEFRSFRKLLLPIEPAGFRAIGANASGKSTLLEAIAMLATTRSPRTSTERELPNWSSGEDLAVSPYTRLRGDFSRMDGPHRIEIGLSVEEQRAGALKKLVRFDERAVRAIDAVGQMQTVLFSPEDVELIAGPPAARRRYLDMAISQASRVYLRSLSRYGRVLQQRNSLLRGFARERVAPGSPRPAHELEFWDSELTATAVEVLAFRIGATAVIGEGARRHYELLTGVSSLAITYVAPRIPLPALTNTEGNWRTPEQVLRQTLSASFAATLKSAQGEEVRRGVTAIGPHRDDFVVTADGIDLGRYGSRGQQRLAVIAIKLAELDFLEEAAGEPPVLLLDDFLSELDAVHRRKTVSVLASRDAQMCITATDARDLDAPEASRGFPY